MPFLTPEIVAHVCRTTGREDIVIPRVGRYWEPLCAMYSKRCLPVVRELLMRGERGLMPLARRCRSKVIAIQGRPRPQRLEQALRDVDTPTDLARAKRLTEVR
ncbi:MAG: hypothetical protein HYZ73_08465, partial [Elusimicrobia bacterium]|nr:hypothetical protein [Elusimicrobiota bacterium]